MRGASSTWEMNCRHCQWARPSRPACLPKIRSPCAQAAVPIWSLYGCSRSSGKVSSKGEGAASSPRPRAPPPDSHKLIGPGCACVFISHRAPGLQRQTSPNLWAPLEEPQYPWQGKLPSGLGSPLSAGAKRIPKTH